ncbi:MAG TPA: class I SAM-dependent methyltransferase [Anaerolineaceae bacterium]
MPTWDALFHNEEFRWKEPHEQVIQFVDRFSPKRPARILDLGCGAGRHVVYLAAQGFQMVGLDNSPTALSLTRDWLDRTGLSARLVCADMTRPGFPSNSFDGLISIFVLYHNRLAAIRQTIEEIHRLLKPGGMALVSFASKRSYRYADGDSIEADTFVARGGPDSGELHHFSDLEEINRLLHAFRIQRIELCEERGDQAELHSHWQVFFQKPSF